MKEDFSKTVLPLKFLELGEQELKLAGGAVVPFLQEDKALFRDNLKRIAAANLFGKKELMLSWGFFDLKSQSVHGIEFPQVWEPKVDVLLKGLWKALPTSPMWQRLQKDNFYYVGTATEKLSVKKLNKTPIGQALYKPLGLPRHLACAVHFVSEQVLVTFSVFRKQPDFAPSEILQLKLLRPYLLGFYEGWAQSRWVRLYAMKALSRPSVAVIRTNDTGRILFSSEGARDLIAKFVGACNQEILPQQLVKCCETAGKTSSITSSIAKPHVQIWQFGKGDGLLDVHIVASSGHLVLALFEKSMSKNIKSKNGLEDNKKVRESVTLTKGKQDHITLTEKQVLESLLREGQTQLELADRKGVEKRTITTQLDQIQQKLGLGRKQLFEWYALIGQLCEPDAKGEIQFLVESAYSSDT